MSESVGRSTRQIATINRLLVIAHRGASWIAPENTLAAFQAALDLGVDLVELDYRESADDVPVVIHDDQLDRTTDAVERWKSEHIRLDSKPLAQLQILDAGTWFAPRFAGATIPTLLEALELITARSIALVERKAGSAQNCIELLREHGLLNRVVLQAFDWTFLASCRQSAPDLTLAALGENTLTIGKLDEIRQSKIPVVAWDHEQVTAELIAAAQVRGLKTWTWTVDDPARMRELTAWGVAGIITNRPDLLLSIRAEQLR